MNRWNIRAARRKVIGANRSARVASSLDRLASRLTTSVSEWLMVKCCFREVLESNLTTSEAGSTSVLTLRPNRDEDGAVYLCQVQKFQAEPQNSHSNLNGNMSPSKNVTKCV
jgi:hypothetical protein